MEDSYRHKGLRKKLLEEIAEMGISNQSVLDAMNEIPRHLFMDRAFLEHAYENRAFQIGAGQTISQPFTVAFQSQLLDLKKGEKVLEIGTGSGYQTCVLCQLGVKVFTIERQKLLHDKSKVIISKLGYKPKMRYGDGYKGWPVFAPFDKIIITCGAPNIPQALVDQLKIGGKLIIPVGAGDTQIMTEITKIDDEKIVKKEHGKFAFVPMLTSREYKE